MKEASKQISIRMPLDILRVVREKAEKGDRSLSRQIVHMLKRLEHYERIAAQKKEISE